MFARAITSRVLVEAAVLAMCVATEAFCGEVAVRRLSARTPVEIMRADVDGERTAPTLHVRASVRRFRLELLGARAQAEDWLRDAGFSLLEDRDADGRRTYLVISDAVFERWPGLRFRARVGRPYVASGLRPRREAPALGVTIPWGPYLLEMDGFDDRHLGYAFMGTLRWTTPDRRVQCGLAVPMALQHGGSIGVLFQVGVRFGQ